MTWSGIRAFQFQLTWQVRTAQPPLGKVILVFIYVKGSTLHFLSFFENLQNERRDLI